MEPIGKDDSNCESEDTPLQQPGRKELLPVGRFRGGREPPPSKGSLLGRQA